MAVLQAPRPQEGPRTLQDRRVGLAGYFGVHGERWHAAMPPTQAILSLGCGCRAPARLTLRRIFVILYLVETAFK
jgi:hypothetical protein